MLGMEFFNITNKICFSPENFYKRGHETGSIMTSNKHAPLTDRYHHKLNNLYYSCGVESPPQMGSKYKLYESPLVSIDHKPERQIMSGGEMLHKIDLTNMQVSKNQLDFSRIIMLILYTLEC